jgi:hypothetical protein
MYYNSFLWVVLIVPLDYGIFIIHRLYTIRATNLLWQINIPAADYVAA